MEKLKEEKNDYLMLSVHGLTKYAVLDDFCNLELALKKISNSSEKNLSYEIISRSGVSSATDVEMKNPSKIPYMIKIIIENQSIFAKQIIELEKKIKKDESQHSFILNEDRELSLDGSNAKPYQIEKDSLRHRLIFLLATEKRFIGAQELAGKLETSSDRIRKTVGQIRNMVKKNSNVSGYSLISTDESTGGYRINNVTLKIPKGYTPL